MLALLFFKPKANIQIIFVASLLILSTVICSFFYIFEQNWLFSIIYQDFVGYMYLGYVGILFAFLCDIAFNRARITTKIVQIILDAFGSGLQALAC